MSRIVVEFAGVPKQLLEIVFRKEMEKLKKEFEQAGNLKDRVSIRIED